MYMEDESCCLFSPTVSQKPVLIPSPQQHERRLPSQSSHLVAKDETACAASAFAAQRWPLPGTAVIVPPSSHRARRDAAVSLKEEETGLVVTETRGFLQCPRTHPTTAESRQDATRREHSDQGKHSVDRTTGFRFRVPGGRCEGLRMTAGSFCRRFSARAGREETQTQRNVSGLELDGRQKSIVSQVELLPECWLVDALPFPTA
ncbi:hypothetical protein GQ607_011309 [Colletotrichum asianum]|uniref:Uncharacterized protein n=1 Tax=Colletotrichum asianum TaxID=702518 RepID=A0A8H3ZIX7_9PEZI|nr:hypothetical protein GQ607_011309 [Colletotrichum asianum]